LGNCDGFEGPTYQIEKKETYSAFSGTTFRYLFILDLPFGKIMNSLEPARKKIDRFN
jgi:uncharacterized protein YceK